MALFRERRDGGRWLADKLRGYAGSSTIVLALPRGGVPVGAVVAESLGLPLDVFVVRKLGVPGHPELAMGAIASGGVRVMNRDVVDGLGVRPDLIEAVVRRENDELTRRERAYRGGRAPLDVRGKTVLLVDDGLATGATMRAAVAALRACDAERIVVAVPVGAPETCDAMTDEADDVVCAVAPQPFGAVGNWYEDFEQTSDEEVQALLARRASGRHAV
jgi:putative phosphoribosyl transferase